MSDFGFAEAERKAKERLQKDVERLTAKRDASLMKLANENKALRESIGRFEDLVAKISHKNINLQARVDRLTTAYEELQKYAVELENGALEGEGK